VHDSEYADLSAWQNASHLDLHSVSYQHAFANFSDLQPDVNAASVWAIHGRGIHIDTIFITTDINGNARPAFPENGVPDIGAYEFTPTSTPPLSIPHGVIAMDSFQVFMSPFSAIDTVASIKWDAVTATPSNVDVRQYSGILSPGITANEHAMYFFTDIKDIGVAPYAFALNVYYKEIWQGTVPVEQDIMMTRNDANGWLLASAIGSASTDTVNNMMSVNYMPSFGLFTGTNSTNALPVKLLGLSGIRSNKDALLRWATTTEANTDRFEIERSLDGRSFVKTGNVMAAGNSSEVKHYTFTDIDPFATQNLVYYRLKIVDKNGKAEYSKIISFSEQTGTGSNALVYPNPFNAELFVEIEAKGSGNALLTVTDLSGKTVATQKQATHEGMNTISLSDTGSLKAGVYFLSVETNGNRSVYKIIRH
jgi:hypothetical protein